MVAVVFLVAVLAAIAGGKMPSLTSDLKGANLYAESLFNENVFLRWRSSEEKGRIVEATAKAFEQECSLNPGEKPNLQVVKSKVRAELRGFLPAWLIWLVVEFFLWKLMDWLWDNWKGNPSNQPLSPEI